MIAKRIGVGLFLGAVLFSPYSTFAGAPPNCDFRSQLDTLKTIHDNSLDYLQEVKTELVSRKSLLANIANCSIEEALTLKSRLQSLPLKEERLKIVQDQLAGEIDRVVSYYENQKLKIQDLGFRGTQDFSRSLKDWRAANYSPLTDRIGTFILWNDNQKLFQTTQNRLAQIGQTVRIFKLVDNEEIQDLFQAAQNNFREAQEANQKVRESFERTGSFENSLALMKSSLEALAKTYQTFFDLSELVRKILPY